MSFTDAKISVVADLRNLASSVRNGDVTPRVGATGLERALNDWGMLEPDSRYVAQAVGGRIASGMQAGILAADEAAKAIIGLTNTLVGACAA